MIYKLLWVSFVFIQTIGMLLDESYTNSLTGAFMKAYVIIGAILIMIVGGDYD